MKSKSKKQKPKSLHLLLASFLLISLTLAFQAAGINYQVDPTKSPCDGITGKPDNKTDTEPSDSSGDTPSDSGEKNECPCDDPPGNPDDPPYPPKDPTKIECLNIHFPFGSLPNEPLLRDGKFLIYRNKPTPTVFSPQGLLFSHPLNTFIISIKTTDLPAGIARNVSLFTVTATKIEFQFQTGSATSDKPYPTFPYVLQMSDSSGNPVTENPAYYDLYFSSGNLWRYPAQTHKAPVMIKTSAGRILDTSSPSVSLEVILDEYGCHRQVKSGIDGLADIVILDEYSYEIRLYAPEFVGAKGGDGLYTVSGAPHTVWKIENPLRSDSNIDNVRATQTINGTSYVYDWKYSVTINDWSVTSGGGARKSWKEIYNTTDSSTVFNFVTDAAGTIFKKEKIFSKKYAFGFAVEYEILDPDGLNLRTEYTYYEDSSAPAKFGLRKTLKNPDGSWESYDYDNDGRMTLKVSSCLDAAFNAPAASAKAAYYYYSPVDPDDSLVPNDRRPRIYEEKTLGITTKKIYYAYKTAPDGGLIKIKEEGLAAYGNSANLRTTETYYPPGSGASAGRLKTLALTDGKLDTYTYEYGTYTPNPDPAACTFTPGSGYALRRTIAHGTVSSPNGIALKSTKETSVSDERGNEVLSETYAFDGASHHRIAWNVRTFDSQHHVLASYNSNGTYSTATWNCCNKDSETTADGVQYTYSYNLLKQLVSKSKTGGTTGGGPVTTYVHDVEDRLLSTTLSGGGQALTTSSTYDMAGRVLSSTDEAGLVTSYSYSAGGRISALVHPGGATEIRENYLDGSPKSVTGTAVIPQYHTYGVDAGGTQWSKVTSVTSSGPAYTKTTVDVFGRQSSLRSPSANGGEVVTLYFYNALGLLVKATRTGSADTLYEYDDFNQPYRTALDLNSNGSIDLASADRVSESDSSYLSDSSYWFLQSTQRVYGDSGAVVTGISKTRLTGFTANIISERKNIDIHGNETITRTSVDRASKTVTQTVNVPDSTADEVSVTVNGLLSSTTSSSSLSYSYGYDGLERRTSLTDPRTGTSTTHYNALGQVDYTEDAAGNRTSYTYEPDTGRMATVVNALGKSTVYTYNTRGQVSTVRGNASYPLDYVYDSYGRMTQLKTYRSDASNPSNADITTWSYQESTGLLLAKTDADAKSVTYTYDSANRLSRRTWARSTDLGPLTTDYSYNLAGDLTGIDYSDSTPDIAFSYNRLGQQLTVTDAVGSRTFSYNVAFQPLEESITGLYSKTIMRSYDTTGVKGRYLGINIGTEYAVGYGYDAYGRLSSLRSPNATSGTDDVFSYAYLPNSNLISSIQYPASISVTKSYEPHRDLITNIENKHTTTTVSNYTYVNDALGRRTSMGKSGSAFSAPDTIAYGYDDKSQVTSAVSANFATYNYGFSFDPIGNRITSTTSESGSPVIRNYTSNNLNQYTAIDNPAASPAYDFDGNTVVCPLSSGLWSLSWNGENRMVSSEKSDAKLDYLYDNMGRRVRKQVYSGSTGSWTLDTQLKFVYDGYKLIEELDGQNSDAALRKYVWSGETPFSMTDADGTFYYVLDANKNVSELIDGTGVVRAHYEYSPSGEITVMTGDKAYENPIRFSSEYFDVETGLVYYNFRYYAPELGRWTSRDPVGEEGAANLYGFISNNPINLWDLLGNFEIGAPEIGGLPSAPGIPGISMPSIPSIGLSGSGRGGTAAQLTYGASASSRSSAREQKKRKEAFKKLAEKYSKALEKCQNRCDKEYKDCPCKRAECKKGCQSVAMDWGKGQLTNHEKKLLRLTEKDPIGDFVVDFLVSAISSVEGEVSKMEPITHVHIRAGEISYETGKMVGLCGWPAYSGIQSVASTYLLVGSLGVVDPEPISKLIGLGLGIVGAEMTYINTAFLAGMLSSENKTAIDLPGYQVIRPIKN